MGLDDADQPIPQVGAGAADGRDLHVLPQGMIHVPVAGKDLALESAGLSRCSPVNSFIPCTSSGRVRRTTKSAPFSLKASTGPGAPGRIRLSTRRRLENPVSA